MHNIVARELLVPVLPRFCALYPRIELDLRDFDTFSGERAKGVDLYLSMGWGEPPDLVHKRVAASAFWVVATPDYLARHGTPGIPATCSSISACCCATPPARSWTCGRSARRRSRCRWR